MISNHEWENLNELVVLLYGIKNSAAMRKAFLTKLMTLIDFDLADFNLSQGEKEREQWLKDPVVVSIFNEKTERAFINLYETQYYKIDYVNWIFAHHESVVYRESDLINDKLRRESKFYKDYLAKYDLGSVAGISIITAGHLAGAITLYKSESKGDFTDQDIYILERLLPHLQNVLRSAQEERAKDQSEVKKLLKYQFHITQKEMEIIGQILSGYSNAEISHINQTSLNTTKSHVANIFEKTGVNSRTQLISFLIKNNFLTLSSK